MSKMTDCIIWDGHIDPYGGYGRTGRDGTLQYAHRLTWFLTHGEIPEGMVVDHVCHNEAAERHECEGGKECAHRACVNIDHLRLITRLDNIKAGVHSRDNHAACPKGHPTTPENTMTRKNGKRECSECNRMRSRAKWANRFQVKEG